MTNVFLRESCGSYSNPVVINYKITHNKNQSVTRPARYILTWPRALVICNQLMNIATYLTQDLREQGHKSYVTSYQANEELVIP